MTLPWIKTAEFAPKQIFNTPTLLLLRKQPGNGNMCDRQGYCMTSNNCNITISEHPFTGLWIKQTLQLHQRWYSVMEAHLPRYFHELTPRLKNRSNWKLATHSFQLWVSNVNSSGTEPDTHVAGHNRHIKHFIFANVVFCNIPQINLGAYFKIEHIQKMHNSTRFIFKKLKTVQFVFFVFFLDMYG